MTKIYGFGKSLDFRSGRVIYFARNDKEAGVSAMKIKGWIVIGLAVVLTVAAITGCGKKSMSGSNSKAETGTTAAKTAADKASAATEAAAKAGGADSDAGDGKAAEDNSGEPEIQASGSSESEAGEEEGGAGPGAAAAESGLEITAVEAFAERIQEAVADKDMEALVDLIEFPVAFVTVDGEEMTISGREDFLKQNPDMIFGDDLMVAVATVDTAALTVEDGVITMGEEGQSLIRYEELSDGNYAITAIRE